MNWPELIISFLGNSFLLAALGYYFSRRLNTLEADLKLKGLIQETVYKNMASVIKESHKRILDYKRAVDAYLFVMPCADKAEEHQAATEGYWKLKNWFDEVSLELPPAIKLQIERVIDHLKNLVWQKGLFLMYAEKATDDDFTRQLAKHELERLGKIQGQTDTILFAFDTKMKEALQIDSLKL